MKNYEQFMKSIEEDANASSGWHRLGGEIGGHRLNRKSIDDVIRRLKNEIENLKLQIGGKPTDIIIYNKISALTDKLSILIAKKRSGNDYVYEYVEELDKNEKLKKLYRENLDEEDMDMLEMEGYFDDIEWLDDNTLIVYRFLAIPLNEVSKFKKDVMKGNIGLYWTLRNDLYPVWGYTPLDKEGDKQEFKVIGHLKLDDIDFESIKEGLAEEDVYFGTEKEIRGKDWSNSIKIIGYEECESHADLSFF
jgi:hypothetical protein